MGTKPLRSTLVVLFTFVLLQETCESSMCPVAKVTECDRYLTDYHSRVHVCSTKYDINFLCDTKTDGGGWIIFQRRVHKYVTFERNWDEYKYGFGKICKDYWLGNDHIHRITSQGEWELRIDMAFKNKTYYVSYTHFYIESESKGYRLRFEKCIGGNAPDMLSEHNGMQFSTPERDNDNHSEKACAQIYEAGWWYKRCHLANLNGVFNNNTRGHGVIWFTVTTDHSSLDSVEMKIRRI
ncbi:Ficolin-1-A [Bulinus truncatus]|nr:Ficolin-1-A [Bulinus truncatus]